MKMSSRSTLSMIDSSEESSSQQQQSDHPQRPKRLAAQRAKVTNFKP